MGDKHLLIIVGLILAISLANATAATANTLPTIVINTANNSSFPSQAPIVYVTAIDNEQESLYVEIFAQNLTGYSYGPNKSYALVQNNTLTPMYWCGGGCSWDGIYTYYARAYDNTTNAVSAENLTVVLDTTNPAIANSSSMHLNQTVYNNTWAANFTITDNLFMENASIELDGINKLSVIVKFA